VAGGGAVVRMIDPAATLIDSFDWCCTRHSTFLRFRQRLTHPNIAERTAHPMVADPNPAGGTTLHLEAGGAASRRDERRRDLSQDAERPPIACNTRLSLRG
jgi:hypothetical protein